MVGSKGVTEVGTGGERLTKSSEGLRMWAEVFIAWGQVGSNEGRVMAETQGRR